MGLNGFFIVWNLPLLRIFNFIQFKSLEKQKEWTKHQSNNTYFLQKDTFPFTNQ